MAPLLSRRTMVRSAAWSAPVVVVVSAAPAFAGTAGLTYASYTKSFLYDDTSSYGTLEDWDVEITATVPLSGPPGEPVASQPMTAAFTVPPLLVSLMRDTAAIHSISGTLSVQSVVRGTTTHDESTVVTFGRTPIPASGPFVVTATGTMSSYMLGTTGYSSVSMADIAGTLFGYDAAGDPHPVRPTTPVSMTPADGLDMTLAIFTVT